MIHAMNDVYLSFGDAFLCHLQRLYTGLQSFLGEALKCCFLKKNRNVGIYVFILDGTQCSYLIN